jgi:hypothetical protein
MMFVTLVVVLCHVSQGPLALVSKESSPTAQKATSPSKVA